MDSLSYLKKKNQLQEIQTSHVIDVESTRSRSATRTQSIEPAPRSSTGESSSKKILFKSEFDEHKKAMVEDHNSKLSDLKSSIASQCNDMKNNIDSLQTRFDSTKVEKLKDVLNDTVRNVNDNIQRISDELASILAELQNVSNRVKSIEEMI